MAATGSALPQARAHTGRERDPWLFGLLGLVFAIGFLSMPAFRYDGDVNAWEMEAESLVYQGRLVVRPSVAESVTANAPYFVFNSKTGYWYSKYGIGNTLVYALPLAFERFVLGQSKLSDPSEIFGETAGPYQIKRRLLLLNGFNLLLSGLLALVLYRLARLYTESGLTASSFVLACLYSTYLWNYTRAQSSQIYQVLLFSTAMLFLLRFARRSGSETVGGARDLLWCVVSLSALCLVKLAFAPLIGVLGIALVLIGWDGRSNVATHVISDLRSNAKTYFCYGVVPLLALGAIVFWVNNLKFGAPFNTGYEREIDLFGASLAESIPAYLFAPRYSIFIHFPLLAVALLGIPRMWKRNHAELLLAWSCFATMFLIYSSYTYWTAEASYGPRYLLFALPVLSLPAVAVVDGLRHAKSGPRRAIASLVLASLILASTYAQTLVNRLEFHTFFRLRQEFQRMDRSDAEQGNYFRSTNTAVFNRDFIRYRERDIVPVPLRRLESKLSAEGYQNLEASVRAHLDSNHYFW